MVLLPRVYNVIYPMDVFVLIDSIPRQTDRSTSDQDQQQI